MKKIIKSLLILFSFVLSIACASYIFAAWSDQAWRNPELLEQWDEWDSDVWQTNQWWENQWTAAANWITTNSQETQWTSQWSTEANSNTTNSETTNPYWNKWINMNDRCLVNWQCSLNIYQTLWIRKSNPRPDVQTFVQDIILALTNFFGTVVAVILVVSWLLYIFSSFKWNSSLASTAKSGIFWSLIWLLLVSCSYAIIRLIQFIATGGA